VAFSSLLSLYVIPAFYSLLAPFTRSPMFLTRKLQQLEGRTPEVGGHA
jgi:multidrug efflux pump